MHFSSDINRPPYEARDGFLQVTSGCTHGTCKFCSFYKDSRFKFSPMSEIEADIKELSESGWEFDRIYLQGADPFIRSYDDLVKIAEMIYKYLPTVKTIGGYARVDNLKNKTVEQLRKLFELGYCYFYFGMESGDDKLLKRMNKGYKSDVIVEQCKKMDEAGMPYIGNFLGGLGGHNYGLSHARETARVINQLKPAMIYASELTLFPDTPLSAEVEEGTFEEATELERIQELQEFIRCLETETIFRAEHVTIPVPVYGKVPADRYKMIQKLQSAIEQYGEDNLRNYRRNIFSL